MGGIDAARTVSRHQAVSRLEDAEIRKTLGTEGEIAYGIALVSQIHQAIRQLRLVDESAY